MSIRSWLVLGAFMLPLNVTVADIADDLKGIDTMSPAGVTKAAATAAKNAAAENMSRVDIYNGLKGAGVPAATAAQAVNEALPVNLDDAADRQAFSAFENTLRKDGLYIDMATLEVSQTPPEGAVFTPTLVDTGYYSTVGTTGSGAGGGGGGGGLSEPAGVTPPPASPF